MAECCGYAVGHGMRRVVQSVGALFAVISLTLLLVSVLTTQWLVVRVNRDGITGNVNQLAFYDRNRGLYSECWLNENLNPMIVNNDFYNNDNCLKVDLTVANPENTAETTDYKAWSVLQLSALVIFAVALLMIFIAVIFYLYTLCQHINRYEWKNGCKISAAMMISALILNALGMALFHIAENQELNQVTDDGPLMLAPYSMFFGADWSEELMARISREYGWSYALSWCAVACELLSAVLFMVVSCCYVKSSKSKSKVYKAPRQTTIVVAQPNPAYERERVVVAPQKVYMVQDDSYYQNGRGTYDPYSNGPVMNGYSPSYRYDQGWVMQ